VIFRAANHAEISKSRDPVIPAARQKSQRFWQVTLAKIPESNKKLDF